MTRPQPTRSTVPSGIVGSRSQPPSDRVSGLERLLLERVKGYGTGDLPMNLNAVAKCLGATDIRYLAREVHGLTDFSATGAVVYLSMSRSDGRRRFTLAHECGHLLLGHDGDNVLSDPYVTLDLLNDIERTCDQIAAELVLPRLWLESVVEAVTDLDILRRLAQQMRVSPAALVVGLRRVGQHAALVRFQRSTAGAWVPVHRIGLPKSFAGRFTVTEPTSQLFAMAAGAGRDARDVELLTHEGACHSFSGFVESYADSAIAFIPDTRAPSVRRPSAATRVWATQTPPRGPSRHPA